MSSVDLFDPNSLHHVLHETDLPAFLRLISNSRVICLDTETTGLDEYHPSAQIVTLALTIPVLNKELEETLYPQSYVVGLSHPHAPMQHHWREVSTQIAQTIKDSECWIIGQNIRFDVRWITALTGVDLAEQISADTGLSSQLMDENDTVALKPRACRDFEIEPWNDFNFRVIAREQKKDPDWGMPWCRLMAQRVDYFEMAYYNAMDTYWTWRLCYKHMQEMALTASTRQAVLEDPYPDDILQYRLGEYYRRISVPSVRTITAMEQNGFTLDQEWCKERYQENLRTYHDCREELEQTIPDPEALEEYEKSWEPTAKFFRAWCDQMCEYGNFHVVSTTEKGVPSWNASALKRIARKGPREAELLLQLRNASKENQFITSWLESCQMDGRIHATYNYDLVRTGRLSSKNPNMQQISRKMKNAFIAAPGHLLVAADFSQIELRAIAFVSGCIPMLEAYARGDDLHAIMAGAVAGIPLDQVTKDERQKAKAVNFGFAYGMGANKFVDYAETSYEVFFTLEEAQDVRKTFFDTWDGVADWHQAMREEAWQKGYVVSPLGRIRHLPHIYSKVFGKKGEAERQAINSPIQSLANDMMLLSADVIRREHPHIRTLGLVHDALIAEVPEDQAKECALQVKDAMESLRETLGTFGVDFDIPLVADVEIGKSWGETQPLS